MRKLNPQAISTGGKFMPASCAKSARKSARAPSNIFYWRLKAALFVFHRVQAATDARAFALLRCGGL
jgi:hypothetical protein